MVSNGRFWQRPELPSFRVYRRYSPKLKTKWDLEKIQFVFTEFET
jgi:hypothetical protein